MAVRELSILVVVREELGLFAPGRAGGVGKGRIRHYPRTADRRREGVMVHCPPPDAHNVINIAHNIIPGMLRQRGVPPVPCDTNAPARAFRA